MQDLEAALKPVAHGQQLINAAHAVLSRAATRSRIILVMSNE